MSAHKTRWEKDDPPNVLLAIDPGARFPKTGQAYAGCALFCWGELTAGGLVKAPTQIPAFRQPFALVERVCKEFGIPRFVEFAGKKDKHGDPVGGEPLTVLAVERPIIYTKGTANPNDIIDLREIYGAFMGGIEAEFYAGPTPETWRGSIDDDNIVTERFTKLILSSVERILLTRSQADGRGGLSPHTLDAVGIGLFTLGRMAKAGLLPK